MNFQLKDLNAMYAHRIKSKNVRHITRLKNSHLHCALQIFCHATPKFKVNFTVSIPIIIIFFLLSSFHMKSQFNHSITTQHFILEKYFF